MQLKIIKLHKITDNMFTLDVDPNTTTVNVNTALMYRNNGECNGHYYIPTLSNLNTETFFTYDPTDSSTLICNYSGTYKVISTNDLALYINNSPDDIGITGFDSTSAYATPYLKKGDTLLFRRTGYDCNATVIQTIIWMSS